jgi:hypothetical protein
MQDPLASWAAIAGAIATFVIALLTFFSIRIARNSLKLMERREKRLHPDLDIFYIESYLRRDQEKNSRIYAVNIRVSNRSDTDNSVKDLSLKIYFKRGEEIISNIAIPATKNADQRIRDLVGIDTGGIITVPYWVRAHDVVSGWALFEVSGEILVGSRIENYEVILTDADDSTSSFEILVMREM